MLRKTGGLTPTARQIPRRFFRSETVEVGSSVSARKEEVTALCRIERWNGIAPASAAWRGDWRCCSRVSLPRDRGREPTTSGRLSCSEEPRARCSARTCVRTGWTTEATSGTASTPGRALTNSCGSMPSRGAGSPLSTTPLWLEALREQGISDARGDRLPLEDFGLDVEQDAVRFRIGRRSFRFRRQDATTGRGDNDPAEPPYRWPTLRCRSAAATRARDQHPLREHHRAKSRFSGWTWRARRSYGSLPGRPDARPAHVRGPCLVGARSARRLAHGSRGPSGSARHPDRRSATRLRDRCTGAHGRKGTGTRRRPARTGDGQSPDGRWQAFYRDHNVWIRVGLTGKSSG
jgi:hypothetical protein